MQVQCKQCLAMNDIPEGTDPHTLTWCRCCTQGHHHGEAAASCPGNDGVGHPGEPCPQPNPAACTVMAPPDGELDADWTCPGGHCGVGVAGCTVCRPLVFFAELSRAQLGV
jgi:hypothetical protein